MKEGLQNSQSKLVSMYNFIPTHFFQKCRIKIFIDMLGVQVVSSHALFLKKPLEDVLQQNKGANQERKNMGLRKSK